MTLQQVEEIGLPELVGNGTLDARIAALLWSIADEKKSFVVAAGPQKAGKSTVLNAALQHAPAGTPIHRLSGEIDEIRELAQSPDGGYLEVGEISTGPPSRYIWGEPVQALFDTLHRGFSLATTMHATSVEGVFEQICGGNEISGEQASIIDYVITVERFGDADEGYWRRVDRVYEIRQVTGSDVDAVEIIARDGEMFRQLNSPARLAVSDAVLDERARLISSQLS